jgi:hypothetical protein
LSPSTDLKVMKEGSNSLVVSQPPSDFPTRG